MEGKEESSDPWKRTQPRPESLLEGQKLQNTAKEKELREMVPGTKRKRKLDAIMDKGTRQHREHRWNL